MSLKFYKCSICGNIVCKIEDSGLPLTCCGRQMTELRSESTDGALEKHLPAFRILGDTVFVQVGSEPHPMEKLHHIQFIALETNHGFHIRKLDETNEPIAQFKLSEDETLIAVYELCNLHGLFESHKEGENV